MKTIPLTKGQVALVDDEDYERLSVHKWRATLNPHTKSYYAVRTSYDNGEKRLIYMHREVMNAKDGEHVDHIAHETCDNQKLSLRICTQSQNNANVGVRADNSSGFKGVSWHNPTQKWQARIDVNGKQKFLGRYSTSEEAAAAYDAAAIEHHGEFAVTNKSLGLLK